MSDLTKSDFLKFIDTPLQTYILPIIPKNATLSDNSSLDSNTALGKIPGRYNAAANTWSGLHKWQEHSATKQHLERWHAYQDLTGPIAVGIQTERFNALDTDTEDEALAALVAEVATAKLGLSNAVRRRPDTPRNVRFYEHTAGTAPIRKRRAIFEKDGVQSVIEYLGAGQQVVQEGPHAKGSMHYWETWSLVDVVSIPGMLPTVTNDTVEAFFRELTARAEAAGYTVVKAAPGHMTDSDRAAAVSIDNLTSPHLVKIDDLPMLADAVRAIDINHPMLADYDAWCALLRAIKAACGGDQTFFLETVFPWLMQNPENAAQAHPEHWAQEKWNSFADSQLGKTYVFGIAAEFGFTDGQNAIAQEMFANATGLDPAPNTGATATLPGLAGGNGGDGGNQPPLGNGPVAPNDTHTVLADAFIAANGEHWRYCADSKKWYRAEGACWEQNETVLAAIETMNRAVAQTVLATVAGPTGVQRHARLLSAGTMMSVRTLLQSRPEMVIKEDQFDADPHLLNTPFFVVDLRTGDCMQHEPGMLLRRQTLVSPATWSFQRYEEDCPRFMAFLRLIADGRDWVIPFLQRWFGYCLSGDIGLQHFLFLQGAPGTGKSQLVTIFRLLMGSYATLLRELFLIKTQTEKRFDMAKIIGMRMAVGDETQKGSKFDETRVAQLVGGDKLPYEIKGGAEGDFVNTTKLVLAGNHEPRFVSAENGGLPRRMLLLPMTHEPITQSSNVVDDFAAKLVAAEGSAIPMWAIEGAMLMAKDEGHTCYRTLIATMQEATAEYARESSPYVGWLEDCMQVELGAWCYLTEAFDRFRTYVFDTLHERCTDQLRDFKRALKALLGDQIEVTRKTERPHCGRAIIKGMRLSNLTDFASAADGEASNVIDISTIVNGRDAGGVKKD